jgi:hypothetical protein
LLTLNALANSNAREIRPLCLLGSIGRIKIENHFCTVNAARINKIGVHNPVVPVDHELRIDPEIKRLVALSDCADFRITAPDNEGS